MTTYTINITKLKIDTTNLDYSQYVSEVEISVSAVSDDNLTFEIFAGIEISKVDDATFIPFDQLTHETVLSWVESSLTYAKIKQQAEDFFDYKRGVIQPVSVTPPWIPSPPTVPETVSTATSSISEVQAADPAELERQRQETLRLLIQEELAKINQNTV